MASSPPVKPPTPGETPPPPATKWPRWRILMLVGAVILLAASILQTMDDLPQWVGVGLYFGGYVLLAYGFFSALSARKGGPTPRDRG